MEFDEVVKERVSVRSFSDSKPNWKEVMYAVDSALQGPFAGNHEHLKFLIVGDKNIIREISNLADQLWISESSLIVLVCSDDSHLEEMYGERGRVYSRQQAGASIMTFLFKLVDV